MCDAGLIESIKSSMLSRRAVFSGAAATTAAVVACGLTTALPALAQGRVVDLTHAHDDTFPTCDGNPGILYQPAVEFEGNGYQPWKLTIYEHTGTHIDAPLPYSADGTSVAGLAPERLVCPLCVIDLTAKAAEDANARVEPKDIEAWVSANAANPAGAGVALHSGWAAKVGNPGFRNTPDGNFAFPGFSRAATDMLAGKDVACIEVDTLSLDPGNSADFVVHFPWLPGGRFGTENMANLDQLPAAGATVFIGVPKHKQGTGGPARVLAVL